MDRPEKDLVITDIRIVPQDNGALRAFATITLNACFVVRGLKVIDGGRGLFVAMPSRERRDGKHQDLAHPITRDFRGYMEAAVLGAFAETDGHGEPAVDAVYRDEGGE